MIPDFIIAPLVKKMKTLRTMPRNMRGIVPPSNRLPYVRDDKSDRQRSYIGGSVRISPIPTLIRIMHVPLDLRRYFENKNPPALMATADLVGRFSTHHGPSYTARFLFIHEIFRFSISSCSLQGNIFHANTCRLAIGRGGPA